MKVHIGKRIKEKIKQSGIPIVEFAVKINYSRRNLYTIFEKESIDTALLYKIGILLNYNFFDDYDIPDSAENMAEEARDQGYYIETIRELKTQVEQLEKENSYLKEINKLLRERQDNDEN